MNPENATSTENETAADSAAASAVAAPTAAVGEILMSARNIVKVLGKGAGEVRALKGVSVELRGGELTLLMGPSGSGKTTLLSILGCILSPTEGEVMVAGRSTKGLGPEGLTDIRRDNIGFIFQSYNLFPTLSALENVRLALDVRGKPKSLAPAMAKTALIEVGLADKLKSRPGQLSGGQQQRVAIARAIAGEPSVVLADEPTAALDSDTGHSIMSLLARLSRNSNRAVLAVTHDTRILGFADRIIHIEDGLIVGEERKGTFVAAAGASPRSVASITSVPTVTPSTPLSTPHALATPAIDSAVEPQTTGRKSKRK